MIMRGFLSSGRERFLAGLGALIGISLTSFLCTQLPVPVEALPLLVGSIGASAVLLFAVPASPLAQPWPVLGGSVIGALVGVAATRLIPDIHWAAGVAVGGAIVVMAALRCLHPPGGAAALTAVIGGDAIHQFGFAYAVIPVGANAALLLIAAILYHRMTGHSYPHRAKTAAPAPLAINRPFVNDEDIEKAMEEADDSFDISVADIKALLAAAQEHANSRQFSK